MPTEPAQTQETSPTPPAATTEPTTPPARTFTQADLDKILARKLDAAGKEWATKVQAEQSAREAAEARAKELEEGQKGETETVEALKKARDNDKRKAAEREAELLKTHQETLSRWDHEKIVSTYAQLVPTKIRHETDLVTEHLVARSKIVAGQVVYTDPSTLEELTAAQAVDVQAAKRLSLVAAPPQGAGARPGVPPTHASTKPRSQMSADELWAADESKAKAARAK